MKSINPSVSQTRPVRTFGLWNNFDDIFSEFGSGFDNSIYETSMLSDREFSPAMDVEEKEGAYLMTVDLPGIKNEDIQINVSDRVLTISGERVKEKTGQEHYFERSFGRFSRSISLPENVKCDEIEAHYENGVLKLALPKAETSKTKTIHVQSGKSGGFLEKFFSSKGEPESKKIQSKEIKNKTGDTQEH